MKLFKYILVILLCVLVINGCGGSEVEVAEVAKKWIDSQNEYKTTG